MATIQERLAVLETKIVSLQRTIWFLVALVAGQTGVNVLPLFFAALLP